MDIKITDRTRVVGIAPAENAGPIPVGKIPDDGTQVTKSGVVVGAPAVLHTVTVGKTLYLSSFVVTVDWSAAAGYCYFSVRDVGDALKYYLLYITPRSTTGHLMEPVSFFPPLEIPAGYDLVVYSTAAGLTLRVFIHGYEA